MKEKNGTKTKIYQKLQHTLGDCGFDGARGMFGLFSVRFFHSLSPRGPIVPEDYYLIPSAGWWRRGAVGQPRAGQTRGSGWKPLARGLPV